MATANMVNVLSSGPNMGTGGAYAFGPGDAQEPAFVGQATYTSAAATSDTINFIDGTNTIPFTPSFVRVSKVGGNDTNAGIPVLNTSAALNNVGVGIIWSIAPTTGKNVSVLVELYK